MTVTRLILIQCVVAVIVAHGIEEDEYSGRTSVAVYDRLVFVVTMRGKILGIDARGGQVRWQHQDEPIIQVPLTLKPGFAFLPDPQDGALYAVANGSIHKLPLTIPQLVQASPCRSSDGILYAGSKRDSWFALNSDTGERANLGEAAGRVCPASAPDTRLIYLGRTTYSIDMFDDKSRERMWNATYIDYSAHVRDPVDDFFVHYYSSCSDGRLTAIERDTEEPLWTMDLGSPVVSIFSLDNVKGLFKLPHVVLGNDTFDGFSESESLPRLLSSVFVGESSSGLYALNSLVDISTPTITTSRPAVPLLDGPKPIADGPPVHEQQRPHIVLDPLLLDHDQASSELIILGYHDTPSTTDLQLVSFRPQAMPQYPSLPHIPTPDLSVPAAHHSPFNDGLSATLFTAFTVVSATLVALFLLSRRFNVTITVSQHSQSAQTTKSNFLNITSGHMTESFPIGKITIHPSDILGRGCEGTVVYRGEFDGRQVAVKRVVADCFAFAEREVDLLRESDHHENVIRYYCMESDSHFRYIAIELCLGTLHDLIERNEDRLPEKLWPSMDRRRLLWEALNGLAYLHSLKIVHRDVKPHNVLISQPKSDTGIVRAVISDFGLCKRLAHGRNSLSQRSSAVAGTDGWIAPEMMSIHGLDDPNLRRVTCQADIFSFACVMYYVLSDGAHPFGSNTFCRQANIATAKYSLSDLRDSDCGLQAHRLLKSMLDRDPSARPSASVVLKHPLFWNEATTLAFLQDVSDRIEKEDPTSSIVVDLERYRRSIIGNDWKQRICPLLQEDLRKFRSYRGNSVRDLLRAIRNKKHHYRELPDDLRTSLGHIPDHFVTYFTTRFPALVVYVYYALQGHVQRDTQFAPYYCRESDFRFSHEPFD